MPSRSHLTTMPPALIVLTLALLLGIQPITTDLYLSLIHI